MLKNRKFCILILLVLPLLLAYQCQVNQEPDLNKSTKQFPVTIPTERLRCLFWVDGRNFLGDGSCYSVWQCDEDAPLIVQATQWEKVDFLFQSEAFRLNYADVALDSNWLPQDKTAELYCLLAGDTYKELTLGFAPEIILGDGLQYKNLLFVMEWYS